MADTRAPGRLGRATEEISIPTGQDGAMDDTVRRRLPFVAELVGFAGLLTIDEVMAGRLGLSQAGRPLSTVVVLAILALTLLRRRFPVRLELLTAGVIALSLAHSGVAALSRLGAFPLPVGLSVTEIVAIGVMVTAVARHGTGWGAAVLIGLGGAAMTAAPFARTGVGVDVKMFAAPGAVIWGIATAFGLVLRDADGRRVRALLDARRAERMRIARELHDLVTHHVTGIVVRAQAAQLVAARQPGSGDGDGDGDGDGGEGYAQIERVATASLTAMRELVGVLRSDGPAPPRAAGLRRALEDAVQGDPRTTIDLSPDAEALDPGPDVAATLHWIVLEALTNVRRHADRATAIEICVRVEAGRALVLDVANDGVTNDGVTNDGVTSNGGTSNGGTSNGGTAGPEEHYGLIGMRERLAALGGTLAAGPEPGDRWRITTRVPVDGRRRSRDGAIEAV
jgi:signal transduction histidine kinase